MANRLCAIRPARSSPVWGYSRLSVEANTRIQAAGRIEPTAGPELCGDEVICSAPRGPNQECHYCMWEAEHRDAPPGLQALADAAGLTGPPQSRNNSSPRSPPDGADPANGPPPGSGHDTQLFPDRLPAARATGFESWIRAHRMRQAPCVRGAPFGEAAPQPRKGQVAVCAGMAGCCEKVPAL